MKTCILQIHNTESKELDQIFIFTEFSNLCKEFEKQFKHLQVMCDETMDEVYPTEEDGEVFGKFRFGNADGSITIGRAYDYHILDKNN